MGPTTSSSRETTGHASFLFQVETKSKVESRQASSEKQKAENGYTVPVIDKTNMGTNETAVAESSRTI